MPISLDLDALDIGKGCSSGIDKLQYWQLCLFSGTDRFLLQPFNFFEAGNAKKVRFMHFL